uniref:Uncharacterized protein n=1 Tax=Physcomitrium patens TaxID=3218 RepID=A0A7I3ZGR0_PHYPA
MILLQNKFNNLTFLSNLNISKFSSLTSLLNKLNNLTSLATFLILRY